MYVQTTALNKLLKLTKRIKGVAGGTSASKTIGIEQILIDECQSDKKPKLTSIVSESFPHLSRGAEKDFKDIMQQHNYWADNRWNGTSHTYTFHTGSKLEFFSVDQFSKVKGPRRDRLFINEANNTKFETFNQLEVRTKESIWLDWNPDREFWWYTEILKNPLLDVDFLTLTYKDNEGLSKEIIDSIESRKNRKGWWQVYGLGQLGEVEGKIYKDWAIIDEIPHEARLERYGLDFGYSNDPTAIVAIYYYNGGYILDEITYQKGLSNRQIADIFKNQENHILVIADSAEPKSIDEIKDYGINILGAKKGQGSVQQGIQYVQDQQISVTKRSTNIIKAYRNYLWKTDKDGEFISPNIPDHYLSDTMDAIRYGMDDLRPNIDEDEDFNLYSDYS
ncbi:MAG: terminase [Deltaproteobacteria bacterium]|nr:terminase [Deltaproteobacteria bacterium]